jgi:hypothetical protein
VARVEEKVGPPPYFRRAYRKARLNERWFKDPKGNPQRNGWHHKEWFVLAELHRRLIIEAARYHSKTQVFGISLPLIEMALDPNIRILIISDVYDKAQQRTKVLKQHLLRNEQLQEDSEHGLTIAKSKGDEEFTLERSHYWLKEPTVTSTYAGAPVSGGRYDIIIADDLVNYLVNARTPGKRQKISRWWHDDVANSVTEDGRIWVIGTHQHHDDLYEELKRQPDYHVAVYPAVDEEDTGYGFLDYSERNRRHYRAHPELGELTEEDESVLWPQVFDFASHKKKKDNPTTHDSYLRQQQQLAVPETGLVFRKPLMDEALRRGHSVEYDKHAAQFLGIDPGYGKRCAMLCFQERAGDRVDMWREHSFTQLADDDIAEVVVGHCEEVGVEAVFIDAADPGLAAKIRKDRDSRGLTFKVVQVPFGKYKKLAIKATRWMLQSGRLNWRADVSTVHTPGRTRVEPSIFAREMKSYALKEGEDDEPQKEDDHGPDAHTAYFSKWVSAWMRATDEKADKKTKDRGIYNDAA